MRCASPMSASSELGGQVRPTARSFARYASSAGVVAVAIAALLSRAAPAIMGMVNLASQRGESIRLPTFLLGIRASYAHRREPVSFRFACLDQYPGGVGDETPI